MYDTFDFNYQGGLLSVVLIKKCFSSSSYNLCNVKVIQLMKIDHDQLQLHLNYSPPISSHHRHRLPVEDDVSRRQVGPSPAVGYRGSGAVQVADSVVHQGLKRGGGGVRCDESGELLLLVI